MGDAWRLVQLLGHEPSLAAQPPSCPRQPENYLKSPAYELWDPVVDVLHGLGHFFGVDSQNSLGANFGNATGGAILNRGLGKFGANLGGPKPIPNTLPFPGMDRVKSKSYVQDGGKKRTRRYDRDTKHYYEWDSFHGEFYVYKKRGKKGIHIDTIDPDNPTVMGPAVPGRTIDI